MTQDDVTDFLAKHSDRDFSVREIFRAIGVYNSISALYLTMKRLRKWNQVNYYTTKKHGKDMYMYFHKPLKSTQVKNIEHYKKRRGSVIG